MSIRRVSDLPSLNDVSSDSGSLSRSFLEVSYLSTDNPDPQRYVSVKIPLQELGKVFQGEVLDGDLSGNLTVNGQNSQNSFSCKMYFDNMTVVTRSPAKFSDISCNGLSCRKIDCGDVISCDEIYTRNETVLSDASPQFVPNIGQLEIMVSAEVARQIEQQTGGTGGQSGTPVVPYLTFVYSDHEINDTRWLRAGSQVDLSKYTSLSSWLFSPELNNVSRIPVDQENSDYFYVIDSTSSTITLPSCTTYIRATMSDDSCTHLSSSVPQISGEFGQLPSSSATRATGSFKKQYKKYLGPNDGTKGNKDWTIRFNPGGAYGRYQLNGVLSSQVVPETTLMAMYYFVGVSSENTNG